MMGFKIVNPDEEYKIFWENEYRILKPIKDWLEFQGYYCDLKPPQTCLWVYTKALMFLPGKLIIRVCLKGRIEVLDEDYRFLAEQIVEKIRKLGEEKDTK